MFWFLFLFGHHHVGPWKEAEKQFIVLHSSSPCLIFSSPSLHFRTAHSHPSALSPLSVSLISSHYISFSLFCSPIIPPTHSHNCSATSKCRSQSHKPQTVDSWNIFVQRPDHYWPVTIHSILWFRVYFYFISSCSWMIVVLIASQMVGKYLRLNLMAKIHSHNAQSSYWAKIGGL